MATDFSDLEMGPCYVTFDDIDLGLTKGGVEVEFTTEVADITADQYGDSILNQYIKGRGVKVKVPMAENNLTKFAAIFPAATLVTNGTNKKLVFRDGVGTSLRDLASTLVLHPKNKAANDKSRDFTVLLAMCKGDMSFAYKHDDQRVFMLEFTGYNDLETGELFVMGDPAVTAP